MHPKLLVIAALVAYLLLIGILLKILAAITRLVPQSARGFDIQQIEGDSTMAITGIVVGNTGTFTETPAPAGSSLQAGDIPKWTADDTTVTIVPATDGTSAQVTVPTGHAQAPFNLTVSGISSDGTAISTSVSVPVLPPAVVPAKGFDINQTS